MSARSRRSGGGTARRGAARRSRTWSRARPCGSRRSSATCRSSFPAPPTPFAAPAAAMPIAIASGARGEEIRRVLDREHLHRVLHRDRRRRGHAGQQAGARSVSARVGTPRAGLRRPPPRRRVRRDRGLALGPRIGARRGTAHGCGHQHVSAPTSWSPISRSPRFRPWTWISWPVSVPNNEFDLGLNPSRWIQRLSSLNLTAFRLYTLTWR